jgi:hypothetical protein
MFRVVPRFANLQQAQKGITGNNYEPTAGEPDKEISQFHVHSLRGAAMQWNELGLPPAVVKQAVAA